METTPRPEASVFISYAWGEQLQTKEWIRRDIVSSLGWKYRVFWDRDSVGFGQNIDFLIDRALQERPLTVLCLCDSDFVMAMARPGSGLQRELSMLQSLDGEANVRIVPVLLCAHARTVLPPALQGRAYLDLTELHAQSIPLGEFLLAVADGCTQAQIVREVNERLDYHALRARAMAWNRNANVNFTGWASTHEVMADGRLLRPPDWMYESPDWSYMIHDDNGHFSPAHGRWLWDHSTPSRAMQALGTATASTLFSNFLRPETHGMFNLAGSVLAIRVFSFIKSHEPFSISSAEIIQTLMNDADGYRVMQRLFPPAPSLATE
ncbi:toll/interleukin-1 receptor domain-containing protein [Stenotrophomonas maltophilia]|uniref:toll/interleukin-1 receptor domain-containing protein n=1 Tax=Stenotrophomonas lactitubi TaxID=2045214 RepID=UPI00203A40E1|nr:toll/interleukin-1 receptor domain-containing protein [Stenotrophomonas lactitubi]MCO7469446.1 toll/interleukin-1 receptor domain-containing protein [Stenotrophomonas maltophilia]